MITDYGLQFSDAQAFTAQGATVSTNVVDLKAAKVPASLQMRLRVSVDTTVTSGGSATVVFAVQTDDNESFTSAATYYTTGAIAKATLVAGYLAVDIVLDKVGALMVPLERYLRISYTVATADLTAGKFNAGIYLDVDANP